MRYAYTVAQIRAAEAEAIARVGDDPLMQRAASALAAVLVRRLRARHGSLRGRRVLLLVGPGNNGGDALFAGVRLLAKGIRVDAWSLADKCHAAGAAAFEAAGGRWVAGLGRVLDAADAADTVVDGLFGIGGHAGLTDPIAKALAEELPGFVDLVAVDLPSGMAADQPRVPADAVTFAADLTVTFGGRKICQVAEPAASRCGEVELVDIGLEFGPPALSVWQASDVARVWPWPYSHDDKYSRGVVGVDAGSEQYPGAGLLATLGAVYAGAGMVRFAGAAKPAALVAQQLPNVVHGAGRCQAYLFGSGWGQRPDGATAIEAVLSTGTPAVIDADGLRHLRGVYPDRLKRSLLTPHAGELASLLGVERAAVESDPLGHVRLAATRLGVTVLLKGATQYVARPGNDEVTAAVPGPAWTAQAGSGDVLAGVCATLLASGLPAADAALAGASLQAMTARNNPGPYPPQELARWFPDTLALLDQLGAAAE